MSPSVLETDGYKFSMAEAGWPLRQETFYYAHRRCPGPNGASVVPFDLESFLRDLMPTSETGDFAYLAAQDYEVGGGFKAAVAEPLGKVAVTALPKGTWFLPREPVFSVTGPSALVSWLEPLALQLSYPIQVATLAVTDAELLAREVATVTCDAQRELVLRTLDAVGVKAPAIAVDEEGYVARVKAAAAELITIVGEPGRIFEVGLRAATCQRQHMLALEALKSVGITRTSHVFGARVLGLVPVGTMGHEHVQRFGNDEAAFRAMRDRRPGRSSYLLDTFDTVRSGIPSALRLMAEENARGDSIRYDSGDKEAQYKVAIARAKELGLRPVQILEDSFDAPLTRRFEDLRREVGWQSHEQFYGYGGYLVAKTSGTSLTRDRVAAVYKLSQSARTPTMKFGDEAADPRGGSGKESVPGRPVVFRRLPGQPDGAPLGLIGQAGEAPPPGYELLSGGAPHVAPPPPPPAPPGANQHAVALSPATELLVAPLRKARAELLSAL